MSELFLFVISIALIIMCGVFVAAEFSFLTVNRSTVEKYTTKGDKKAAGVGLALKSLSTQLSGAQVGITLTNLAIGFLSEPLFARLLKHPLTILHLSSTALSSISIGLGVALATVLTMVLGELVPKNIAIARPLGTAKTVQGVHRGFTRFMFWPIRFLNGNANVVLRQFGLEAQEELASARSADELASLVRRSAAKGTLSEATAQMLQRSLAFGDLTALDVMTPRVRVKTVQVDDSIDDVIELAKKTGFSRFPVVQEGLDQAVGMLHIKRAIAVPEAERNKTLAESVMQPLIILPSSIELDPLLGELRKGGLQMAVIIDEFGGADGIVTIEDLIEELVGEVYDEHDRARTLIRKSSTGGWILSGLLRPDEIGQDLGIFLPEEREYETIGGLFIDRLAHLPKVGESVDIEALNPTNDAMTVRLEIERMDGRRIDRIRMIIIVEPKVSEE
jgi:CBS domain containing-hemolysin-like protein